MKLNERVVVFRDGLPFRALGPGRHSVWGFSLTEQRWSTDALLFQALPEVRAVLPADWYGEVALASDQRAVVYRDGRPVLFLRSGTHRYWKADESVRVELLSVKDSMPELTSELAAILPRDEFIDVTVREYERGLEYVGGRLTRTLEPGRYAVWSHPEARVEITTVDMRLTQVTLAGQELMTRDKVTLRLSLTIEFAIDNPALATHAVANVRDAIYLIVQLASREYVSSVTLDELLGARDAMTRVLHEYAVPKAHRFEDPPLSWTPAKRVEAADAAFFEALGDADVRAFTGMLQRLVARRDAYNGRRRVDRALNCAMTGIMRVPAILSSPPFLVGTCAASEPQTVTCTFSRPPVACPILYSEVRRDLVALATDRP